MNNLSISWGAGAARQTNDLAIKIYKEPTMKKLTFTFLFLALLLAACGKNGLTPTTGLAAGAESQPATVTAEGKLLPALSAELAFAQGGVIAEVLVRPGDKVAAGDVLARLVGIETVQAELAAARLEQTTAQQALDALRRHALLAASQAETNLLAAQAAYEGESNGWNLGSLDEATALELTLDDYLTAEQEYRAARDRLNGLLDQDKADRERMDAQDDFDRQAKSLADAYADLLKDVAAHDQPLDEEQARLLNAIAVLEVARQDQARLGEDNLDPEQLAAAQAAISAATAHVAAAQAALELYELRAPFAGLVLSHDLVVGETALPGLIVAYLADTASWTVETRDLAEIDIARVSLDQNVTVKLDAFPGEEFPARVTAIDPVGQEYLGDMTYQVTVTLVKADERFKWFMTATVTIPAEE
jgi:HlyD family secretion protein